jgi:hypothetical protein
VHKGFQKATNKMVGDSGISISKVDANRAQIKVIFANEAELKAHDTYSKRLHKVSRLCIPPGRCFLETSSESIIAQLSSIRCSVKS